MLWCCLHEKTLSIAILKKAFLSIRILTKHRIIYATKFKYIILVEGHNVYVIAYAAMNGLLAFDLTADYR